MKKILGVLEWLGRTSLGIVACLLSLDMLVLVTEHTDSMGTVRVWCVIVLAALLYAEYLIFLGLWRKK